MVSRVDMMLWVLSTFYAVALVAAFYALAVGNDSLFQLIALLLIDLTGVAVWTAFLARPQKSPRPGVAPGRINAQRAGLSLPIATHQ